MKSFFLEAELLVTHISILIHKSYSEEGIKMPQTIPRSPPMSFAVESFRVCLFFKQTLWKGYSAE